MPAIDGNEALDDDDMTMATTWKQKGKGMTQVAGPSAMPGGNSSGSGLARRFRMGFLSLLAAGSVLTAASPAWASNGFAQDEYEVEEPAGYVELAVIVKFCCPMGQGQIDYYTSDLTAVAGQDYQQTSGTVTFVTGTYGRQDIRIPIYNDELIEGEERFEVKLTNFRGSFVDRGYETAVVRILDDDARQSSGNSATASPGPSNQQTTGSEAASSARPPSLHSPDSSSGSTDAGVQSGTANPDDLTRLGESGARHEVDPFVGKALRDNNRPSSLPLAGLGTLLLVLIGAASFGLKKRLGRRVARSPYR